MSRDTLDLFKYALILALLLGVWFALMTVISNILVQVLLNCIAIGIIASYFGWLKRNKLKPPRP